MKISETANDVIHILKKVGKPLPREDVISAMVKRGYSTEEFWDAYGELQNVAHIGSWSEQNTNQKLMCYYPPNELTNKVQACLDRGDDW